MFYSSPIGTPSVNMSFSLLFWLFFFLLLFRVEFDWPLSQPTVERTVIRNVGTVAVDSRLRSDHQPTPYTPYETTTQHWYKHVSMIRDNVSFSVARLCRCYCSIVPLWTVTRRTPLTLTLLLPLPSQPHSCSSYIASQLLSLPP